MTAAAYTLYIDWANNGTFGAEDDMTSRLRAAPGVTTVRGKDQIRALAPPMAGRLDGDLDNQDRELSFENSGSSLVGNLLPGRKVRLQAVYAATTYYLWTGFLDDLPQHPYRQERTVSIPSLGSLSRMVGKTVSTALYSSIRTDEAIGYVLDAVGWPAGDRVLDTGKTTLDWWWLQEEDAFSALSALVNTEGPGGVLYEDGQGRIVFESRHYRQTTTRSNTSQATISDTGSEPLHSMPFAYNPGLKDIINVAQVTTKTRATQALAVVWSLGQSVTLFADEFRSYVASATDPFSGALTPVDATDYTVSVGSLSSVTIDRDSGQSVTITLTAGASGATVTGLQLRAQSVTVQNTVLVSQTFDTTASIAKYGRQPYALSIRAELAVNTAQDLVNAIVSRYQAPRPTASIAVNNGADDRVTQILSREISDRITVVEAQTGINSAYWVERIEHKVDEAGKRHVAVLGCEKAATTQYAAWGTAVWGTDIWGF